ncbi:MAG: phosphoglycerate mutase [Thermomonas sp.]|uniref:phosphoglycerate mutase n=1 Tax=Thermomonas sp. TaxID=1971895 RepID=UPI0039E644BD
MILLPPTTRFAGIALPQALAKALGRADRSASDAGEEAQLARHFDVIPRRWPAAPLTRLLDSSEEDARLSGWLRADPAYIRPDINGARLLGIGDALGIDPSDVDALLPALRPLFGDVGFPLDAPVPGRWYLRLPREAKLPAFASPDDALGEDVFEHIPDGAEARRWRALASEAQVTLHNHPHNAARIAAGKPPINALWFWGGGVMPDHAACNSPTVFSDDPRLHGLARIGNFTAMPVASFNGFDADALIDLRARRDARELLERWLSPVVASGGELTLDFADGTAFTLKPGQRWRFWRRPLPTLAA